MNSSQPTLGACPRLRVREYQPTLSYNADVTSTGVIVFEKVAHKHNSDHCLEDIPLTFDKATEK